MAKKYCYFCNSLVDYTVKNEECEYNYRNKNFTVKEDRYYCVNCQNELASDDLDGDLKRIYDEYYKLVGGKN